MSNLIELGTSLPTVVEFNDLNTVSTAVNLNLQNIDLIDTDSSANPYILTNESLLLQKFSGSTAIDVHLPNATTLFDKYTFQFYNNSSAAITVYLNDGTTSFVEVAAGVTLYIVCVDVSTSNGVFNTVSIAGNSSGTVTTVSVVNSNGFSGSVENATTTPAITLSTGVTGILLGDSVTGAISAATAGDFPVLNQDTTGNAATATNVSGGSAQELLVQTASNTTNFIANVTNSVLVTDGSTPGNISFSGTLPTGVISGSTYVTSPTGGAVNSTELNTALGDIYSAITGLQVKDPCAVVFTSATGGTYDENSVITGTTVTQLNTDGYTVQNGDRVLLTSETSGGANIANGIYLASGVTAIAYTLTRTSDFAFGSSETGSITTIINGTTYGGTGWICNSAPDVGTAATILTRFAITSNYTGTAPIQISDSNVISVDTATTGNLGVVEPDGTSISIDSGTISLNNYVKNATFAPVDGSSGELTFISTQGLYSQTPNQVTFSCSITYPTTTDTGLAQVVLPSPIPSYDSGGIIGSTYAMISGFASTGGLGSGGISIVAGISDEASVIYLCGQNCVQLTNASLSGLTVYLSGTYQY